MLAVLRALVPGSAVRWRRLELIPGGLGGAVERYAMERSAPVVAAVMDLHWNPVFAGVEGGRLPQPRSQLLLVPC